MLTRIFLLEGGLDIWKKKKLLPFRGIFERE
jgi:hypothetical protein